MRKVLALIVILLASVVVFFVLGSVEPQSRIQKLEKIESEQYQEIFKDLKTEISNISPTPPTEDKWIVLSLEFAKDTPLTYITYHDTHNIFRILVEVGKLENDYHYLVKATFEKTATGWRVTGGEDLAKDLELIQVK